MANRRKSRMQTPVVSCYPAPAPVHDLVLLFLPPWSPHLTPLATGSLKPSLLVSPLLGRPARYRRFALAQSTPAILDQESVRTTLSITHHRQERPSTGPRTLWSSADDQTATAVPSVAAGDSSGGPTQILARRSPREQRREGYIPEP
jgi:hypothetical protein